MKYLILLFIFVLLSCDIDLENRYILNDEERSIIEIMYNKDILNYVENNIFYGYRMNLWAKGFYDTETKRIYISTTETPKGQKADIKVVIHEIAHYYCFEYKNKPSDNGDHESIYGDKWENPEERTHEELARMICTLHTFIFKEDFSFMTGSKDYDVKVLNDFCNWFYKEIRGEREYFKIENDKIISIK